MTDEAIREQNSEQASGQKLPDKLVVVVVVTTKLQTPESRDKDTQVTGRHAGSPCSATALRHTHAHTHTQVLKRITARDQRRGVHWLKERPCLLLPAAAKLLRTVWHRQQMAKGSTPDCFKASASLAAFVPSFGSIDDLPHANNSA